MKGFNIYYKGKRINSKVASKNDIDKILGRKYIYKSDKTSDDKSGLLQIPVKDIKIVECYVF